MASLETKNTKLKTESKTMVSKKKPNAETNYPTLAYNLS